MNQVRHRRGSPSESEDSSSDKHPSPTPYMEPPTTGTTSTTPLRKSFNRPVKPVVPKLVGSPQSLGGGHGDSLQSLKVKWTPKKISDSEEEEGENFPRPLMKQEDTELSLKIKWDPSKAQLTNSEDEEDQIMNPSVTKQNNSPGLKIRKDFSKPKVAATFKKTSHLVPQQGEDSGNLKINWNPSKAAVSDDSEDEETPLPQRKWKVKQVQDDEPTADVEGMAPPQRKWKVKQVQDDEPTADVEGMAPPQRKWKVKQVQDDEPTADVEGMAPPQRKWKVKQVQDDEPTADVEGMAPPQRKWKVKQVQDDEPTADVEGMAPPQRKWKVKQVQDDEPTADVEGMAPPQRKWKVKQVQDDEPTADVEGTAPPQRKWKVKQVQDDEPTADVEGTPPPQRKWNVKQVPEDNKPATEDEEDDTPKQATVKRSGTFTKKDKPSIRDTRNKSDDEISSDDNLKTNLSQSPQPVTAAGDSPLKVNWNPNRNVSPTSSEEDTLTRSPDPQRQSRYTAYQQQSSQRQLPRPGPNASQLRFGSPRGRGQIRIPSPARYATTSPLQQQRNTSLEGVASRSPSPKRQAIPVNLTTPPSGTATSQITPPSRSLRPPSPRRTSQLPQNSAKMTTPTRIRSPNEPFTATISPSGSPSPRGISPARRGGAGVKISQPLTPPQSNEKRGGPLSSSGQRKRTLPVLPSNNSSRGISPRGRGGTASRHPKPPEPQGNGDSDDSWLEGCF